MRLELLTKLQRKLVDYTVIKYVFIYAINTTTVTCNIQLSFIIQPWYHKYVKRALIPNSVLHTVFSYVHFTHSATVEPVYFKSPRFILWTIKSVGVHIYFNVLH